MKKTLTELAKEWIGTPWIHNQSVKHLGCDCVGFLIGVGKEYGVISDNFKLENYHRLPRFNQIIKTLDTLKNLYRVDNYEAEDILVIKFGSLSCHVMLCLDNDFAIHADQNIGYVQITTLNFYKDKISAIYRIKK